MGKRGALLKQISITGADLWGKLNSRIEEKTLLPVISNTIMNNRIFDINDDGRLGLRQKPVPAAEEAPLHRLEEQFAREWAEFIHYPLAETPLQLCRVAQYNQIKNREDAKCYYLAYLKVFLLELALEDDQAAGTAELLAERLAGVSSFAETTTRLSDLSFSEIAFQLGYPRFEDEPQQNPFHLLAQLPLPIYATTGHHDFIERALRDVGKHPRLLVCHWFEDNHRREWFGEPPDDVDLEAEPSETHPLVYHLYGLEKYPNSLVISEDDYLDFLVKVSEDKESIPLDLRHALAKASLLLLGYPLRSWEFRMLFRGLLKPTRFQKSNLAIQLNPQVQLWEESEGNGSNHLKEAQKYLEDYFDTCNFKIEWDNTSRFLQKLRTEWRKSQQ